MLKYQAVDTFIGLDIGSVSVKSCLIATDGTMLQKSSVRITDNAETAINAAVLQLERWDKAKGLGVSGSGRTLISSSSTALFTSPLALATGVLQYHPEARCIIQLGGHNTLIVHLEDGLNKPWKTASNPLCAAGTGRFIEQQSYRLGLSLDDFSRLALEHTGTAPRIAARCSVFAKSDLIHLQQKGVALPAMLYALCQSVARMVTALNPGTFEEPLYLAGGLANSSAIIRALKEAVSEKNGHTVSINIAPNPDFSEAYGAALLSRNHSAPIPAFPLSSRTEQQYFKLPPLSQKRSENFPKTPQGIKSTVDGYLGIDVGSTSTKAVIMDAYSKEVLAKNYIMTSGRPVDAVRQLMRNLIDNGADKINILGAGVTGSGRYLIGHLIGADLIKNEITAQTRCAAEIDSCADIIEIGGQDSKLVLKRKGIVVDYQMNKACAAGTGSFIDELAEMLNVKVTNGDFANLAFRAPYTVDLGTRCAAFIGQSVTLAQQGGAPLEVIAASLSDAIAKNYLSKVVGHRKLGNKVILTGAVFYNEAVVAAFRAQLGNRTIDVAPHREVSGAIGVALLAQETQGYRESNFKGFLQIINRPCELKTFVCQSCDNNCTITRMALEDDKATFYGSRCDRYDSLGSTQKQYTAFDEYEKLLLANYKEKEGHGPVVGLPRALFTYVFAPLLIGFLNALDARVLLSGKTTSAIMEKASEIAYSDSCFPLKLMHGHVDDLKGKCDFILNPSAIRIGRKESDRNQKYACPLVQAAPFIVRQTLKLGNRMISPLLDFSLGDDDVIANLTQAAIDMGFGRKAGRQAAQAGINAQKAFHKTRSEFGSRLLEKVRLENKTGVVIFSRAYMSQDSGANLGIAEMLANLDVVPIPMDCLPLDGVNIEDYSDRPYWEYESIQIAVAAVIARTPNLYGLVITNFGCGPNSFILPILEDIMGDKPMGQLEIDEHAAEAGLVTRVEAFVDTIHSYHTSLRQDEPVAVIRRSSGAISAADKTFVVPRMAPFIETLGAVMQSKGCSVIVLPEPNELNLLLANRVTSGTECLPYRITLGDYLRFFEDKQYNHEHVLLVMAGSYGPCRLGKYALEQNRALHALGYPAQVLTTVSNNAYRDINFDTATLRYGLGTIFAVDWLERLLWRTRPYERITGQADALFQHYLQIMVQSCRMRKPLTHVLRKAAADFVAARDKSLPRRPLVGINGEIYLRTNTFSNNNLVRECEAAGLEVVVSPMGEWIKYTSYRNMEDHLHFRRWNRIPASFIKYRIVDNDDTRLFRIVKNALELHSEPSIADILRQTQRYLSPRCGSEAVLSIGAGVNWITSPHFAGVISVMPHGCMPGGIVAAMAEQLSAEYNKPWISLTYDGIMENNNHTKITNFAELIRYCAHSHKLH
ncbi:MAG: acyl-CoA dehydratase activase-related protein [Dehalococcoidia bacterium]|nr:acyl-CoA dehydratase activase-related protein [Dehalococcoidia bacterium]